MKAPAVHRHIREGSACVNADALKKRVRDAILGTFEATRAPVRVHASVDLNALLYSDVSLEGVDMLAKLDMDQDLEVQLQQLLEGPSKLDDKLKALDQAVKVVEAAVEAARQAGAAVELRVRFVAEYRWEPGTKLPKRREAALWQTQEERLDSLMRTVKKLKDKLSHGRGVRHVYKDGARKFGNALSGDGNPGLRALSLLRLKVLLGRLHRLLEIMGDGDGAMVDPAAHVNVAISNDLDQCTVAVACDHPLNTTLIGVTAINAPPNADPTYEVILTNHAILRVWRSLMPMLVTALESRGLLHLIIASDQYLVAEVNVRLQQAMSVAFAAMYGVCQEYTPVIKLLNRNGDERNMRQLAFLRAMDRTITESLKDGAPPLQLEDLKTVIDVHHPRTLLQGFLEDDSDEGPLAQLCWNFVYGYQVARSLSCGSVANELLFGLAQFVGINATPAGINEFIASNGREHQLRAITAAQNPSRVLDDDASRRLLQDTANLLNEQAARTRASIAQQAQAQPQAPRPSPVGSFQHGKPHPTPTKEKLKELSNKPNPTVSKKHKKLPRKRRLRRGAPVKNRRKADRGKRQRAKPAYGPDNIKRPKGEEKPLDPNANKYRTATVSDGLTVIPPVMPGAQNMSPLLQYLMTTFVIPGNSFRNFMRQFVAACEAESYLVPCRQLSFYVAVARLSASCSTASMSEHITSDGSGLWFDGGALGSCYWPGMTNRKFCTIWKAFLANLSATDREAIVKELHSVIGDFLEKQCVLLAREQYLLARNKFLTVFVALVKQVALSKNAPPAVLKMTEKKFWDAVGLGSQIQAVVDDNSDGDEDDEDADIVDEGRIDDEDAIGDDDNNNDDDDDEDADDGAKEADANLEPFLRQAMEEVMVLVAKACNETKVLKTNGAIAYCTQFLTRHATAEWKKRRIAKISDPKDALFGHQLLDVTSTLLVAYESGGACCGAVSWLWAPCTRRLNALHVSNTNLFDKAQNQPWFGNRERPEERSTWQLELMKCYGGAQMAIEAAQDKSILAEWATTWCIGRRAYRLRDLQRRTLTQRQYLESLALADLKRVLHEQVLAVQEHVHRVFDRFEHVEGLVSDGHKLRVYGKRPLCNVRWTISQSNALLEAAAMEWKAKGRELVGLFQSRGRKEHESDREFALRCNEHLRGKLMLSQYCALFGSVELSLYNSIFADPGFRDLLTWIRVVNDVAVPCRLTGANVAEYVGKRRNQTAAVALREQGGEACFSDARVEFEAKSRAATNVKTLPKPPPLEKLTEPLYQQARNKQESESRYKRLFFNLIAAIRRAADADRPGQDVVCFVGAGALANLQAKGGGERNRLKLLIDMLSDHFLVVYVDEQYTSQLCPRCFGLTEEVRKLDRSHDQRDTRSRQCNSCKVLRRDGSEVPFRYHRDVGASDNIFSNVLFALCNNGARLPAFQFPTKKS